MRGCGWSPGSYGCCDLAYRFLACGNQEYDMGGDPFLIVLNAMGLSPILFHFDGEARLRSALIA